MVSPERTHQTFNTNIMKKFFFVILISFIFMSCDDYLEELKPYAIFGTAELLYLDSMESEESNEELIANRRILKEYVLDKQSQRKLVKAMMLSENFEPTTRRCRFDPVYAIKINKEVVVLFDVEFCPGLTHQKKDGSTTYYQLKKNSPLESELRHLINSTNE